jgi:hypothetical protein
VVDVLIVRLTNKRPTMSPKQGCWLLFFFPTTLAGVALCIWALSQSRQSGPGAPLEGVVTGIGLLIGLALLVVALISFFLRPRTPVSEIHGAEQLASHLPLVSRCTGLLFPPGARLVGLCHERPSLESRVATKFVMPECDREAFLLNRIFTEGIDRPSHYELGSRTVWWLRGRMQARVDRVQYLSAGTYVECSLGIEDGQTVVYVSWA